MSHARPDSGRLSQHSRMSQRSKQFFQKINLNDDAQNEKNYLDREKKKLEKLNERVANICKKKHHQHLLESMADCCDDHHSHAEEESMDVSDQSHRLNDIQPLVKRYKTGKDIVS